MQFMKDARQQELLHELRALAVRGKLSSMPLPPPPRSVVALAESCSAALARDTYVPGHFTASGFVLSPSKTELLLIRHKKLGMWLQPGGHIEPTDRDLADAARREVREETSLKVLSLVEPFFDFDVHEIPPLGKQPAHLHHDVRSLFIAGSVEVVGGDDAAEARWFSLAEIADSVGDLRDGLGTDESVRRVARLLSAIEWAA